MLCTKPFLSFCCVRFASPGCADPIRAVLDANTFARDKGGAAVGMAADCLLALIVLLTMAAPLPSVGYAPLLNTLAVCSVFGAQASRDCFGGAAFHRARLPAMCTAETSCINRVGAPINRAHGFLFFFSHFDN